MCLVGDAMKLTCFGHSCFLVESAGTRFLFDPFIRPNPLAAHIEVEKIQADVILISHAHMDHIADAVELATRTGAKVLASWEVADWLGKQGVTTAHPMNHGGSVKTHGARIKMVNAIHSSSLPDGSYGGNPAGFVVETSEGSFYYSGGTALTLDMNLIAEEFDLAFAVLPIGDNFTMGATDAVKAARLCGAEVVVGVHYDTFPPITINKADAVAEFEKEGFRLVLPAIGATVEIAKED